MGMTDPLADMLTRIRNASRAGHDRVDFPASKVKAAVAEILRQEGYVAGVEVVPGSPVESIRVTLKYSGKGGGSSISGIKRVSRPGLRVYAKADRLPKVLGGMGTVIISTSSGVMTDKRARRQGLGGEVLAFIW